MKPLLVPRSELAHVRAEVDEWRRRAEVALGEGDRPATPDRPARGTSRRRWLGTVATVSVAAAVVAIGALTLPGRTQSATPDYPGCIGKARYEHPVEGNQYQELVNALYACGVYRLP